MSWRESAVERLRAAVDRARAGAVDAWRDPEVRIALAVFLASVLLLTLTASHGFVRDEGYYFRAAREYHSWFEGLWRNLLAGQPWVSFGDVELRRAFGYNTEHPGFAKIFMGWTWKVFHGWLGLTSQGTGFRLASIIMVAFGNAFLFLLGARLMSRAVGLLAVILLMASPHVFYHAHLACFDGPIVGMTVVVAYAFWRSLRSRAWILWAGIFWGVAVATKHNAVFLVPTLGLAWVLGSLDGFRLDGQRRITLPSLPLAFLAMALLGPIIFMLFYPYGWHDPVGRIGAYYQFHLHHNHYPVDFLGTLYSEPPFPWSFPFVFSGLTIPLTILVPGLAGAAIWLSYAVDGSRRIWKRLEPGPVPATDAWLLLLNLAIPPLIIAVPTVPIFGGTKHWMPMMPFLALFAAWACWRAVTELRSLPRFGTALAVALLAGVVLLPVVETARSHPLGHTYFNELAGGHQGGAALGMPRTFWGGDARELLPILNDEASNGAAIFTDRMNYDDFSAYQKDGLLRADLRWISEVRRADWALVNHQREHLDFEYSVWALTGDQRPRAAVSFDDVPIVTLYRIPRSAPPATPVQPPPPAVPEPSKPPMQETR